MVDSVLGGIAFTGNGLNVEYEGGMMGRRLFLVFQVVPGGIAARSGKLRMGDRILKVNGEDVTKSSHHDAVLKLLRPGDEVVLTIQHDPLPEGYQVGTLLT